MSRTWPEIVSAIEQNRIQAVAIARKADINESTVRNALKGRNTPLPITRRAIDRAVTLLLSKSVSDSDSHTIDALETAANISSAKAELEILRDTTFEDAANEMQPSSLERFADHLRVNGRRNANGHKQWREYVLIAGAPLEITEDGTEPITPARALELLGAL